MGTSSAEILGMLQATDGMMHKDDLSAVLNTLSPGEWNGDKFTQLVGGLGETSDGMVNVSKLFGSVGGQAARDLKIAVFSADQYVQDFMQPLLAKYPGSFWVQETCCAECAHFCHGARAVCLFVNDEADREVLKIFKANGVEVILLRCAGFDRVDLHAAEEMGIKVVRVPAYSPFAVAEHAVSLVVTLNRRLHIARNRVRVGNYDLSGLVGMDLNGRVCGILGTGKIGQIAAKIFKGFGMKVICYDVFKNSVITEELGLEYVDMDEVYARSDVISIHVPLLPSTRYMINRESVQKMKPGVILVNVSRGGLIDTKALIEGLSAGIIRGVGLDVYEHEADLFFKDFTCMDYLTRMKHWDEQFALLRTLPNVIISPHIAFLTKDALGNILSTTVQNADEFVAGKALTNEVKPQGPPPAVGPIMQSPRPNVDDLINTSIVSRSQLQGAAGTEFTGTPNNDFVVAIFSASGYVRTQMKPLVDRFPKSFFIEAGCTATTAHACSGANAVCLFVNDEADEEVIQIFKAEGIKLMLLRCAGFDRADIKAADAAGIKVARVPAYSPYAVAEQAVSLTMALNRRLCNVYNRVSEGSFILSGLVGMDLQGKVCGVLGTGKIGQIAAKIFKGLGMDVLCYDVFKNDVITKELGLRYAELDEIYAVADVITVHVPLLPTTKHIINKESIAKMKNGVMIINVSRGGLLCTKDLLEGLISGKVGAAGLDVYENEREIFFKNFSAMDDVARLEGYNHEFMRLRSLPNVLITPHTAFLTHEALSNICSTTIENAQEYIDGKEALTNEVKPPK
mmetsp:Transcript_44719/g.127635  ORF Transcript_44719/g.127635 Transcript_44719/m.127635 type:complete len:795 (-) Transcript_44719:135-2519(-)